MNENLEKIKSFVKVGKVLISIAMVLHIIVILICVFGIICSKTPSLLNMLANNGLSDIYASDPNSLFLMSITDGLICVGSLVVYKFVRDFFVTLSKTDKIFTYAIGDRLKFIGASMIVAPAITSTLCSLIYSFLGNGASYSLDNDIPIMFGLAVIASSFVIKYASDCIENK